MHSLEAGLTALPHSRQDHGAEAPEVFGSVTWSVQSLDADLDCIPRHVWAERARRDRTVERQIIPAHIDERPVADHRTDTLRLAVLIRTGVINASARLKRLSSYPRANILDRPASPQDRHHIISAMSDGTAPHSGTGVVA